MKYEYYGAVFQCTCGEIGGPYKDNWLGRIRARMFMNQHQHATLRKKHEE